MDNSVNLFCLPYAGGNKYAFRKYQELAPSFIRCIPLELPGRGKRLKEPLLDNITEMVEDIFGQISHLLSADPFAIYGHSLGGTLAYLLAHKIKAATGLEPKHLFISGCSGPSNKIKEVPTHMLDRAKFIKKLREIGGSPEEILNDSKLLDFFEPMLRADFKAVETFEYRELERFNIPITAIIGLEEKIAVEDANLWEIETHGNVKVIELPGDHFFIFPQAETIIKLIAEQLQSYNLDTYERTILS